MRISDLIRNPPHAPPPPKLIRPKKTKRKHKPTYQKPKKKQKLVSATLKDLSKEKLFHANKVFDVMANKNTNNKQPGFSIFLFMVVDLYLAFPYLKIFENISWLHGLWNAGLNAMANDGHGTLLENKAIWSRTKALNAKSEHLHEEGVPIEAGLSPKVLFKEVTSVHCHIDEINFDKAPALTKTILDARKSASNDDVELAFLENGGFHWTATRAHGRAYVMNTPANEELKPTFWKAADRVGSRFHTNHAEDFTSSPSNPLTILKIYLDRKKFCIGFREAIWIINQLKNIKRKPALEYIKRYEETLIYSKEWQAAFCLLSAVKVSTFATYLGALNTFFKFLSRSEQYTPTEFTSIEVLIQAIKNNSLHEDNLVAYVLYRISRVKFSTLRGNLTALSFFYRHISNIDFWSSFKRLQNTVKSCSTQFDEDSEGSIYLSWENMKKLLLHVFQYDFSNVEKQVIFDCLLLSFWFGFRISEACDIWFRSMCIIAASTTLPPQLRACIVDSKTNNEKTPWHMVTLTSFPEREWRYWCPLRAFQRLQRRRSHNQNHIFTRKNGKPFTKSWLDTTFRKFVTDFRKHHPHIIGEGEKCTFHVFRVSAMGFYIRELNLSIYETQSLIRHKLGSRTTEQIYLAKSLQAFNESAATKIYQYTQNTAASKILHYVAKNQKPPPEEKEFLINCNNAGLAKRFGVFKPKPNVRKPMPFVDPDDEFFQFSGPKHI